MADLDAIKGIIDFVGQSGLTVVLVILFLRLYVKAQEDRIADLKQQMDEIQALLEKYLPDRAN